MMLSEQELEFPKLFPSLLKTVRPLLSISHANKESDFFRENVPHHSVAPGKASTCISGSAYNTRGTTIDTTRYRHKSAKHKSEEAGGDANAGDPQTHMTLACTEGVAGAWPQDADLLAQVCRAEDEMDGEQLAEEAHLSCNLSSGSYCTGSYCTPLQRAPLSAKYVSAPTFCVADQRLEHAAGSAHAAERGCKSDVSVAEGAGTWDVASGMAGVGLGLGIACAAAACIRFMRRC
jgi:hypothetical protein